MTAELRITIRRDVVMDELCECASEIGELVRLVPDYSQRDAKAIAHRIMKRMRGWITVRE